MATTYTVTTTFATDTTAVASQVNQNFTDVLTALNSFNASNLDSTTTVPLTCISGLTSSQCAAAFFKDEDAMTSDSATAVSSQQAIKAYVTTQIDATAGSTTFNPLTEDSAAGSDGVTRLSNGLRIARGTQTVSAGAEDTVSPTGFTKVYCAIVSIISDSNTDYWAPKIGNYSGANFTIRNTNSVGLNIAWIAVGR